MNIENKTETELQALAYQNIMQIQALQNGLRVIEEELQKRKNEVIHPTGE